MAARKGNATFVQRGYGQVEPNHLSAPRSGHVYGQLPADAAIDMLENGQFVKYDYADGHCNFTGAGPWMMVFNEIKIYRDFETDADFAMIKDNYVATVHSPGGVGATQVALDYTGQAVYQGTHDPYKKVLEGGGFETRLENGETMYPRVMPIEMGDIYTTNTIMETTLVQGDLLTISTDANKEGYLVKAGAKADAATVLGAHGGDLDPVFQVVKVYTMPDMQPGVKLQRIA